jgi:hypothetical protein
MTTPKIDPETVAKMLADRIATVETDMSIDFDDAKSTGERVDLAEYEVALTLSEARTLAARVAELEATLPDMARVSVGHAIDAAYGLRAWEHWMKRAEAAEANLAAREAEVEKLIDEAYRSGYNTGRYEA